MKSYLFFLKDTYEQAIYDLSHNEKQTCYINKQCLANLVLICKIVYSQGFIRMLIDGFDLDVRLIVDRKEQKYIRMIKEAFIHEQMKTK